MTKKQINKRDQFTQSNKSKLPIIALAIGIVVIAAFLFIRTAGKDKAEGAYFGEAVASSRSYVGEFISMTSISPTIDGDKVKLSLEEIDKNNIVFFEIANDSNEQVPLMAYITPSGRLFVGSSLCEPCRGRTFSLAGETLVCDTCRTTYDVETHEYISGSPVCGQYPPVNMNPVVVDGEVEIQLQDILSWKSRI